LIPARLQFVSFIYFGSSIAFEFANLDSQRVVKNTVLVGYAFQRQVQIDDMMPGDYFVGSSVSSLDLFG
jgi:hypothetical protein